MLRPVVLIGVLIVAVMSFGLFQLKYEVTHLEDELARLKTDVAAEEETIRVLKAEWSFLNRPERLQALAERHLSLVGIAPVQIRNIEQIPTRKEGAGELTEQPSPVPGRSAR